MAPAFAASLTHLTLHARWADRPLVAARLSKLPDVYPHLQKCHIGSHASSSSSISSGSEDEKSEEWLRLLLHSERV